MNIFKALAFLWKYKKEIASLKKEIIDVQKIVMNAQVDNDITQDEFKAILKEVNDVYILILEIIKKEQ